MRIPLTEVTLDVTTAGPPDGPMVLLLHGFPESARGWRHQIGPLADRGYFVVVPDQRGYAGSDHPPRIRDYALDRPVADALGLIRHFDRPHAHVVCHDWGGMVGRCLAIDHPDQVRSFCVMNAAHPRVFARRILLPPQVFRSWYALLFQVPWLPERLLAAGDFARLAGHLRRSSRMDPADIEAYRQLWRGSIGTMLAWYRAAFRYPRLPSNAVVRVPTLIVWGRQDETIGFSLAGASAARCTDVRLEVIEEVGHFVQHDAADRVNALLAEFLPGDPASAR